MSQKSMVSLDAESSCCLNGIHQTLHSAYPATTQGVLLVLVDIRITTVLGLARTVYTHHI